MPGYGSSKPRSGCTCAARTSETVICSTVVCGRRLITLATGGTTRGVQGLHERILASLRCDPDPAEESTLHPRVATPNPFPWTAPGFGHRTTNVQRALDPARSLLMRGAPALQLRPPGLEAPAR